MIISLIAILSNNHVIGRENTIPWYFASDMSWFQYHTFNKPVIMGRKTFESIGKKSLSGRFNIVLSNKLLQDKFDNVVIVNNLSHALSLVEELDEIMIIGGSSVYNMCITKCHRMYLTYIDLFYDYGDAWFPKYNHNEWKSVFNAKLAYNTSYYDYKYNLNFRILDRY